MKAREALGIAVDATALRVVCIRGTDVLWTLESSVDADATLGSALAELLARAPRSGRRPRVTVISVGPSLVQVRRLDGLPSTDDETRERVLSEGVRRWFLVRAGGLLTAGPFETADGAAWGAAFERSAIDELRTVIEHENLALLAVVPAVVILGEALSGDLLSWGSGANGSAISMLDGRFAGTQRQVGDAETGAHGTPGPFLDRLGMDARHFADALAAALIASRGEVPPLALAAPEARTRAVPGARARSASLAAVAAVVLLLLAYPFALWRTHSRLTAELDAAQAQLAENAARSGEHARVSEALDAIERRRVARNTWITPIARINDALPAGTAIVTLRADSAAGVIVILGPRAGAVIDRLEDVPGIVSPALVGPVTTETVGGQLMERATIAFALVDRPRGAP